MKNKMKSLMKTEADVGAKLVEVDIPQIGADEVLVKVDAAAICGTDAHIYKWDEWSQSRIEPPLIFGHEFCGTVVEIGEDVDTIEKGDFVSAEGHFTCGSCFYCRTGQGHICQEVEIIGVDTVGCFAEYVSVPAENIWKMDSDIPLEIAAIYDPFGNAVHTAMMDDLTGKSVAVIGCGPIGLAAVAVAEYSGAAKIFATDINEYRLDLAKKLGADRVINVSEEDPVEVIEEATGGVDVMLEFSGQPTAIRQGFAALKGGGWASLLGIPSKEMEINLSDAIIFKGATVYGINGRQMWDTWYKMASLLEGGLDLEPLITHRFAFEDYEEAFDLVLSGNCGKVILYPNKEDMLKK
ncbi:L-threonine 3-dehydrogenase [Natroniella sulfidigena]|uniref:L-threonine 3-dehydrogenase n=1 Tax=Natroniella sulfidigena TaxID=723921 RepID=UPI00200B1882|nr:L-threonine 3-dehydrogenase [Natroniella sulfidigena]MCK8817548.1 L-threonine 3-dehydrogenase [Natroniella sulfidigena]